MSDSPELKITPYEDYKDANGDQKEGFKTKSINHIINIYNLKKWKGEGTLDIANIIDEFIKKWNRETKKGELSDEEIKELQSIKDRIVAEIKAENAQQQLVDQNTNAAAENVEMQETDSDEVDEVDETKQIDSQQPIEQPVEPTAQPEMKQVETPEEKREVAKDVEVKDVITIERPKTRFSKAISIDIPNTTNQNTSVVYTLEQYTIPTGLEGKFKPLGVRSLKNIEMMSIQIHLFV